MGTASWQPKWWTQDNATAWGKVKESLKRDWEQTKADLHMGGKELDQNVTDTVKQATGKEAIPPQNVPNTDQTPGRTTSTRETWEHAEQPMMYGYGARQKYGAEHAEWNDKLESHLKSDWDSAGDTAHRKWEDVKQVVRHGYDKARA